MALKTALLGTVLLLVPVSGFTTQPALVGDYVMRWTMPSEATVRLLL